MHDSIKRSREGIRAVSLSLAVLGLAAVAQTILFVATDSVALLADVIHNFGDALTAVPLAPTTFTVAPSGSASTTSLPLTVATPLGGGTVLPATSSALWGASSQPSDGAVDSLFAGYATKPLFGPLDGFGI